MGKIEAPFAGYEKLATYGLVLLVDGCLELLLVQKSSQYQSCWPASDNSYRLLHATNLGIIGQLAYIWQIHEFAFIWFRTLVPFGGSEIPIFAVNTMCSMTRLQCSKTNDYAR